MHVSVEYKAIVNEASEEKRNVFIPNCDVDHAIYLTELLIKRTKDYGKIDIFSRSLCESVYADEKVLNALKDAKKRNVKIRIILEEYLTKEENELCKEYNLELCKLIKSTQKQKKHKFNYFLVSDNVALRFEESYKKNAFKNNQIIAEVNFNSKKSARTFSNLFNKTLLVNSEMNVLREKRKNWVERFVVNLHRGGL